MIRVYIRGRDVPFRVPDATEVELEGALVRLYGNAQVSEGNPYKSTSNKFAAARTLCAVFRQDVIDAVLVGGDEDDD